MKSTSSRRVLPTNRAHPRQQIRLLQKVLELTGPDNKSVRKQNLSAAAGLGLTTVSEALTFLADVGLVESGRGECSVTRLGYSFAELWDRDSSRARLLLKDAMRDHWAPERARALLRHGSLPQEELARRLREGIPGVPKRGVYLVEWLVISLVIERDKRLYVSLPESEDTEPSPHSADGRGSTDQPDGLPMGLTSDEIKSLPDAQYIAFLHGVDQTIKALDTES